MNPALKNIDLVASKFYSSPLTESPIWNMPVSKIDRHHLFAFTTKWRALGRGDEAVTIVRELISELNDAAKNGVIDSDLNIFSYSQPSGERMSACELKTGLAQMLRPRPAAVLFALETGIDSDEVVTLTWNRIRRLRLSQLAWLCLDSQPRHIRCNYVFWQEADGKPTPIYGLTAEIFDTFQMVWSELKQAYDHMAWVDYQAESQYWGDITDN